MSLIGQTLREKREKLGYSIEEISDITTIQKRYIEALENDHFEIIPGDYYVRSFIKQYATILKLDSNKLIKQYQKDQQLKETQDLKGLLGNTPAHKPARPAADDTRAEEGNEETNRASSPVASDQPSAEQTPRKPEVVQPEAEPEEVATIEEQDGAGQGEILSHTAQVNQILAEGEGEDKPEISKEDQEFAEAYANTKSMKKPLLDEWQPQDTPGQAPIEEPVKKRKRWPWILLLLAVLALGAVLILQNAIKAFVPTETTTTTTVATVAPADETSTTTASTSTETTTESTTSTSTTTTQATTTAAPVTTTTVATTQAAQENNTSTSTSSSASPADVYVMSEDASQITYGLGSSFANYTGNYDVVITVSEPTWVRVDVQGQVVYERTLIPNVPYRMYAYNNAASMTIRTGITYATAITLNGQSVHVPTTSRVENITFNFAR